MDDLRNRKLTWRQDPLNRHTCQILFDGQPAGFIERKNVFTDHYAATLTGIEWRITPAPGWFSHVTLVQFAPRNIKIAEMVRTREARNVTVDGVDHFRWERIDNLRGTWRDDRDFAVLSISANPNIRGEFGFQRSGSIRIFEAASLVNAPILALLALKLVYYDRVLLAKKDNSFAFQP